MAKKKKIYKGLNKYGKMRATKELTDRINLDTFDPHEAPGFPTVEYWVLEFSFENQPNVFIKIRPHLLMETYSIKDCYEGIKLIGLWSIHKMSSKTITLDEFREKYKDIFIDPRSV